MTTSEDNNEEEIEPSDQMRKLLRNQLKVVLLVRDPQGIYNSRKGLDWCKNDTCLDPSVICSELEQDMMDFTHLHTQQPDWFTLIRYEDLALNRERDAVKLLQRPGLTSDCISIYVVIL